MLEYFVVELAADRIPEFIPRSDRFEVLLPGPDGILRSEMFPGLWLESEALCAEDRVRLTRVLDQGLATPEYAEFVQGLAEDRRRAGVAP